MYPSEAYNLHFAFFFTIILYHVTLFLYVQGARGYRRGQQFENSLGKMEQSQRPDRRPSRPGLSAQGKFMYAKTRSHNKRRMPKTQKKAKETFKLKHIMRGYWLLKMSFACT